MSEYDPYDDLDLGALLASGDDDALVRAIAHRRQRRKAARHQPSPRRGFTDGRRDRTLELREDDLDVKSSLPKNVAEPSLGGDPVGTVTAGPVTPVGIPADEVERLRTTGTLRERVGSTFALDAARARGKRPGRDLTAAEARQALGDAGLLAKTTISEPFRMVGKGLANAGLATAQGVTNLAAGPESDAAESVRDYRDTVNEFYGEPHSALGVAAQLGAGLAGGAAQYMVPGAALGRILGPASALNTGSRAAQAVKQIAVNTATSAPIDAAIAASPEDNTATFLGDVLGSERMKAVGRDTPKAFAVEVATGLVPNALLEGKALASGLRNLNLQNRSGKVGSKGVGDPFSRSRVAGTRVKGPDGRITTVNEPLTPVADPKGSVDANGRAVFREVEPEVFDEALRRFSELKPDQSGFITWRTPEQMRAEGMRTFLGADGKVGYAVHPESGDIRNVFNADGPKGAGAQAVAHAVEHSGGKILDAFDTKLTDIYRGLGFRETWRSAWDDQYRPAQWNEALYGRPDVIGMEFAGPSRRADDILASYQETRQPPKSLGSEPDPELALKALATREKAAGWQTPKTHSVAPRVLVDTRASVPKGVKPLVTKDLTGANFEQQTQGLDRLAQRHADPLADEQTWVRFAREATGSRVVPEAPSGVVSWVKDPELAARKVRIGEGLNETQVAAARQGLETARKFRRLIEGGQFSRALTAKAFSWSFLSRMLSAYPHEHAFLEVSQKLEPYILKAMDGKLTAKEVDQLLGPAYKARTHGGATVTKRAGGGLVDQWLPAGSGMAGVSAKQNVNAYVSQFLWKLQDRLPDGRTKLQALHEVMTDVSLPSQAQRRRAMALASGAGVDAKIISFTQLMLGRDDVIVIDRVQTNAFWDTAAKHGVENGYDNLKLAALFEGGQGLAVYEAIERSLGSRIADVYARAGRDPAEASLGRFHWETWVGASAQDVGHQSIEALLRDAGGDPRAYANAVSAQGKYTTYHSGAFQGFADGHRVLGLTDSDGTRYALSREAYDRIIAESQRLAPKGFQVDPPVTSPQYALASTRPFYLRPDYPTAARDALIRQHGTPLDALRADGGGSAVPGAGAAGPAVLGGPGSAGRGGPGLTTPQTRGVENPAWSLPRPVGTAVDVPTFAVERARQIRRILRTGQVPGIRSTQNPNPAPTPLDAETRARLLRELETLGQIPGPSLPPTGVDLPASQPPRRIPAPEPNEPELSPEWADRRGEVSLPPGIASLQRILDTSHDAEDIAKQMRFLSGQPAGGELAPGPRQAQPVAKRTPRFKNRRGSINLNPEPNEPERVVAAAIKHPDGRVTHGVTHFFALGETAYEDLDPKYLSQIEEGFLTNTGRFVNRTDANRIVFGDEGGSLHTGDLDVTGGLPGYEGAEQGVLPVLKKSRLKNRPGKVDLGSQKPNEPETLVGVAMRGRLGISKGKVFSQEGFDGGHGAVWKTVQEQDEHALPHLRDVLYEDGFITSTGRFVRRDEALEIAKARHIWNGQNRAKLEKSGKPGLMSEAVESPRLKNRPGFLSLGGPEPRLPNRAEGTGTPYAAKVDVSEDERALANLAKLNLSPEAEAKVRDAYQRLDLEKKTVTHAETMQVANELGLDPRRLLDKQGRLSGAELLAVRDVISSNAKRIVELSRQSQQGSLGVAERQALLDEVTKLTGENDEFLKRYTRQREQAGRDLNALRIIARDALDVPTWLVQAERLKGLTLTQDEVVRITQLASDSDRDGLVRYVSGLRRSTPNDKLVTLWKAGLLTSLGTHAANLAGNAAFAVTESAKEVPAALVDAVISLARGTERTKAPSVRGLVVAPVRGFFGPGMRAARRVLRYGSDAKELARWDFRKTNYGDGPAGRIAQAYTDAVFNTLSAEDQLFRAAAVGRSLEEQARLIAKQDKALRRQLRENPTPEMMVQALADAEVAVFANDNLANDAVQGMRRVLREKGKVGQGFETATQVVAPFVKTPSNIVARTIEYSPPGLIANSARLAKALVKGIEAPDQKRLAEAMGRGVLGSSTFFLLGFMLAREGKATGSTPKTERERSQWQLEGKIPNGVLVGDTWRSFARLGPPGMVVATGAQAYEAFANNETAAGKVAGALYAPVRAGLDQSFLKGVSGALAAADDPEKRGGRLVESTLASVVPSGVAQVARATDPYARETRGLGPAVKGRIPGLRQQLPERLDAFGRPVREGTFLADMLDPTRPTPAATDPLVKALAEAGASVGFPSRTVTQADRTRRKLTDEEYRALLREVGPRTEAALRDLLEKGLFSDARETPDDRQDAVAGTVRKVRAAASRRRRERERQQQAVKR